MKPTRSEAARREPVKGLLTLLSKPQDLNIIELETQARAQILDYCNEIIQAVQPCAAL